MKSCSLWFNAVFGFGVLSLLVTCGCDVHVGNWGQAKFERPVSHQAPLAAGGTLDVATQAGSITITGADATDCKVEATIVGYAPTQEEAQQLAEQTEIRLEPTANGLKIRADKPDLTHNRSVAINYTITAPRRINVLCESDYGSLNLTNLDGTIKGRTSSGSIRAEGIGGPVDLKTSYGSITCRDLAGPTVLLQSSSGDIAVVGLKGSAKIETSYGSIKCENASGAQLDLQSKSGSLTLSHVTVSDCLAETDYGSVTCNGLKSKTVKLRSSSGSIGVTDAQSDKIDLHTSYGRVHAQQVTTGDLLANSGSGNLEIVCSPACPPSLQASAKTAYGSIAFTAPPQFSGEVRLSTEYGSVQTALPVTVTGRLDKKNVVGRIGEGTGTIRLETDSGSIDLK